MKKLVIILLVFLVNLGSMLHAASSEEASLVTPTTLFRVQPAEGKAPIYLLGSVHTKPYETYPSVVLQAVDKAADNKGYIFTEVSIAEPSDEEMNTLFKILSFDTFQSTLKKKAQDWREDESLISAWIDFYKEQCIGQEMKPLIIDALDPSPGSCAEGSQDRELPLFHPSFIKYLKAEGVSPALVKLSEQGLDMHAPKSFSLENQLFLETYEERFSITLRQEDLENFYIFKQDMEWLKALYADASSSPTLSEADLEAQANIAYQLLCQYPLVDFSPHMPSSHLPERNRAWARKLDSFFASSTFDKPLLIIVGAAHLGGETGFLSYFHEKKMPIFHIHEGTDGLLVEKEFKVDPALFDQDLSKL